MPCEQKKPKTRQKDDYDVSKDNFFSFALAKFRAKKEVTEIEIKERLHLI
jgi:hypothetical protein